MGVFRDYMWLWVICGIVFGSVLVIFIFCLLNKWLSKRGKLRVSKLERGALFNVESNNYQERVPISSVTPPLPPRTQFLTEEFQSYENLAEELDNGDYEEPRTDSPLAEQPDDGDYEEPQAEYEQAMNEQLDYVKVEDQEDLLPPPPLYHDPDADLDDYEEPQAEYEQALNEQLDYVKVEAEEDLLPPPPLYHDPDDDDASTEDYDDIGGEDENQDEEDYDDVG